MANICEYLRLPDDVVHRVPERSALYPTELRGLGELKATCAWQKSLVQGSSLSPHHEIPAVRIPSVDAETDNAQSCVGALRITGVVRPGM